MLFQPPPITRYDLNFNIFGIPVRVHPLFWLLAILLGSSSNDLSRILVWVLVVFVSILIHELGHAFALRSYGQPSQIVLHMTGGLTIPESINFGYQSANISFTPNQQILVSLAGPFAGFLFAAFATAGVAALGGEVSVALLFGFIPIPSAFLTIAGQIPNLIIATLLWVNVFWGLMNLLPIYPLDGGNVTRYLLLQADPLDGVRKSLWISVIVGVLVAIAGLLFLSSIYLAFLFGFLAFQSYQSLRGYANRY